MRSVLPPGIPNNEGVFRAIEVICPPGTVGNGVLPAACAARGLTGFRMVDCMFGALAMMLPDKVKAAGDGGNTGISIGGYDADAQALRLCRLHLRRLGRAALGRRARRQFAHVRQHGLALGRGDRGRAADPAAGLRVRGRQGRRRQVSRRRAVPARLPVPRGRRHAAGPLRPARPPAVRPLWRQPRRAVGELSQSRRREPAAALQAHHDDQARATSSATYWPAPAAGAIRWSAIPPRCCATSATSFSRPAKAQADYGVVIDTKALDGRRRPRPARAPRRDPQQRAAGRRASPEGVNAGHDPCAQLRRRSAAE